MHISEFFNIFDFNHPYMDKVGYFVSCHDYNSAKKELLKYFILRKEKCLSSAEPITQRDKNPNLAYIARHGILSGPNENDIYLSSMFLSKTDEYTSLDVKPFLKDNLSFMIMSRQKEPDGAFFYSPLSIFPPYISLAKADGTEIKVPPAKYAYISTKSPDMPLADEDIYEICEESDTPDSPYGLNTGRVYLGFDFSYFDLSDVVSARFMAKVTLPESILTKELLFFNVSDSSWGNSLTWSTVKGNVYSWESSPDGPAWTAPEHSDSEYLNVTSRFWFARPMAYQYITDIEHNRIYGEKLLFLMDAFSKKKTGGFNRVLETGERLSNFACVLNALIDTPVMTADYLVSILWMMYRDMKHLIENPDLGWSNWAVVRTSGLSKAIDFLPELKEHRSWKTQTRDIMNSLFDKMYSPDFSFREAGFAYSFWCLELFSSAVKVAHINNDPYSAFMRSRLEKAFDASLDFLYPDFYDTNVGDSNYQDKTAYLTKLGSMFPTKKLRVFMERTNDDSVSASSYYPYSGSVVMRNGFGGKNPMYLGLFSTPFDGHAHNDLGNVIFYGYGRPLLCDTGRYGYSQNEISHQLKTAAAHNTIEIPGCDYTPHSESEATISTFVSNTAFDYAESIAKPYKKIDATHKRRVLFVKNEGFAIVSDHVTTNDESVRFNQNWHFMPGSNALCDYEGIIKTAFKEGGNIKLACPDADAGAVNDCIFSSGYGIAENAQFASFTKYAKNASFTTLLLPYADEEKHVSARSFTPEDLSGSIAVFDIGSDRGVFYANNTSCGKFMDCVFDGDMAFVYNGRFFIAGGKHLEVNTVSIIDSPADIMDMYLKVSGGIVEIESSSLHPTTKRDEAIRIYAPKTTHVLLNGAPVPFTLYSDYIYAVAPN